MAMKLGCDDLDKIERASMITQTTEKHMWVMRCDHYYIYLHCFMFVVTQHLWYRQNVIQGQFLKEE